MWHKYYSVFCDLLLKKSPALKNKSFYFVDEMLSDDLP